MQNGRANTITSGERCCALGFEKLWGELTDSQRWKLERMCDLSDPRYEGARSGDPASNRLCE